MNLFSTMRSGGASYGTVPGNGSPTADDKLMNVGPGHVVPAKNAHIAKKIVKKLGYDPDAKVSMNQGGGQGANIRISSKEFFLNDDQVDQMHAMGIDPEILSPDSDYNQRVKGGTTKQAEKMVNKKLSMYDMMSPALQEGASTNEFQPYERPDLSSYPYMQTVEDEGFGMATHWYDELGRQVYSEFGDKGDRVDYTTFTPEDWAHYESQGYTPEIDPNNLPPGMERNMYYGVNVNPLPTRSAQPVQTGVPSASQQTPIGYDPNNIPANIQNQPAQGGGNKGEEGQPNKTVDEEGDVTQGGGLTPEEQYVQDMVDKNKRLTDAETATNAGLALWNLSRSPQDIPAPVLARLREMERDYKGMELQGKKRTAASLSGMMKTLRETGQMHLIPGVSANIVQADQQQASQIWDIKGKDQMMNQMADNQRWAKYADDLTKHGYIKAKHLSDFQREKGKAIADNIAQIYDVQDEGFQNEATLKGYQVQQDEQKLSDEYAKLDVKAIKAAKGQDYRLTKEQYMRLPRKEQEALLGMQS